MWSIAAGVSDITWGIVDAMSEALQITPVELEGKRELACDLPPFERWVAGGRETRGPSPRFRCFDVHLYLYFDLNETMHARLHAVQNRQRRAQRFMMDLRSAAGAPLSQVAEGLPYSRESNVQPTIRSVCMAVHV